MKNLSNYLNGYVIAIILITVYYFLSSKKTSESFEEEPCRTDLTDIQYLEHMIPHHQVAVDVSIDMLKVSKSPIIQEILRKLIWTQNREIVIMKNILKEYHATNVMAKKVKHNLISIKCEINN